MSLPTFMLPPVLKNHGNYIISLGNLCRWLGELAESMGVEIYPGFAASEVLYNDDGSVKGVVTGDMGVTREGEQGPNYQVGMELHAKYTFFAEGCRGSLGKQLMEKFNLREGVEPQTYGIGIKELWEIEPRSIKRVLLFTRRVGRYRPIPMVDRSSITWKTIRSPSVSWSGWTMESYLSPYEEFQRFKMHPKIKPYFEGGRRVACGARALNEGGFQSLPKLTFPGGVLVGCEAGTLNTPKIKGSHTAMKSGMLAAEAAFEAISAERGSDELVEYADAFQNSWVYQELSDARNVRPGFKWGLYGGMLCAGIDQILFRAKRLDSKHGHADHERLERQGLQPIEYPKADGVISFDRLTNVSFSATNHEEDQPIHLTLKDDSVPVDVNLADFAAPEQRYCPAGVYEILYDDDGSNPKLQINSQNCVHCKTCDIKDPTQNIVWVTPEGGGGPNYPNM